LNIRDDQLEVHLSEQYRLAEQVRTLSVQPDHTANSAISRYVRELSIHCDVVSSMDVMEKDSVSDPESPRHAIPDPVPPSPSIPEFLSQRSKLTSSVMQNESSLVSMRQDDDDYDNVVDNPPSPPVPAVEQSLNKPIEDIFDEAIQTETQSCPKCSRSFAKDRFNKHVRVCQANSERL